MNETAKEDDDAYNLERLAKLFVQYEEILYNKAFSILHDHHKAEDAVQDTFTAFLENIEKTDDISESGTRGYLFTIFQNVCRMILRNNRKYLYCDLEDEKTERANIGVNESDDMCLDYASYKMIINTISTLPENYRKVIVLDVIFHYSSQEIARGLKLTAQNVRKRQARGRQLLKKVLFEKQLRDQ